MKNYSRARLAILTSIFREYCNDTNGITLEQIQEKLEKELERTIDRKAIYKDIATLKSYSDMDIVFDRSKMVYKITKEPLLNKEEVGIITDLLITAKFISYKTTKDIINKLNTENGVLEDKKYKRKLKFLIG